MKRKKDGFINQRAIVLPQAIKSILTDNDTTRLLHITDIGYYPYAEGHYRARETGSEQNILIYCIDGKGWFSINNTRLQINKGQFFIIEAGIPHIYGADENTPWSIYWIHFTGEKSHLFKPMYNKVNEITNAPEARLQDRLLLFEEIYQNLQMGYSIDNLEYTSLCLWHFLASFRFIPQFREVSKSRKGDIIQEAIGYMRANLKSHLTLNDIAAHVHYSPSHFGQIFIKKTGYSPLHYYNQLKIQKACQLLDFSDKRIKEIAQELGFYDQYHFSKIFVRHMGEAPKSYRNRNKG